MKNGRTKAFQAEGLVLLHPYTSWNCARTIAAKKNEEITLL